MEQVRQNPEGFVIVWDDVAFDRLFQSQMVYSPSSQDGVTFPSTFLSIPRPRRGIIVLMEVEGLWADVPLWLAEAGSLDTPAEDCQDGSDSKGCFPGGLQERTEGDVDENLWLVSGGELLTGTFNFFSNVVTYVSAAN